MIPSKATLLACLVAALAVLGCVGTSLGWKAAHDRETVLSDELSRRNKVAVVVDTVQAKHEVRAAKANKTHEAQNETIDKAIASNRDWANQPLPNDVFDSLRN